MEVEALAAEQRIHLEAEEAERRRVTEEAGPRLAATAAIRSYYDAIEEDRPHDPRAAEWVAWARTYAATIDPLASTLAVPEALAEVNSQDLRPFLAG